MVLLIVTEFSLPFKDFGEGYTFSYIHEKIAREIKHKNIVLIDPLAEFSRINSNINELRVWTNQNLKANNIIAGYIIEKFKENNINFCNQLERLGRLKQR